MSLQFLRSVFGTWEPNSADVFEVIRIDSDYISTMQIKNRTLKKMLDTACCEYKLEEEFERNKEELTILGSF